MTTAVSRVLSRRVFCAVPLMAASASLRAESERTGSAWPRRPVRLVTRSADGAGNDAMARTLAAALSRRWRQPVLVDHCPGADGTASVETFLAAHDDHALLLSSTAVWTTLHLTNDNLTFDPERDLVPLAPVVQDYIAIGVAPTLGLATLGEVIGAAHRSPGKLTWSSSLHAPYLAFSAFLKAALAELSFVPSRNPLGAAADLAEGRVDLAFLTLPLMIGAMQPGRIHLVAVAGTERAPSAPDVPTVVEAGFPSLAMQSGYSLFGPRDMPVPLRARIADDVGTAVRDPVVAQRLALMGYRPKLGSPATFQALLQRERVHWSELAHASYSTTAAQ